MKVINYSGRHRAWLMCVSVILASPLCIAADPAISHCDPGLQPAGGSEVGYAVHGDRCEGLYIQEVSGGTLEIASFTENFKGYKFAKDKPLLLEWPAPGDGQVQVRASSLKQKLYYRMDTLRSPNPPSYTWPPDILSRLELGRNDIGLLAWTEQPFARGKRKIYLPLRVTSQQSPALSPQEAECYQVVLRSSVELQEVYVTLCPLDSNGKPAKAIRNSRKLDYGYYRAGGAISFRIYFSELSGAPNGLYSLSVGAELSNGDPRNAPEVCFFHPSGDSPWPKNNGGMK